MDKTHQELWAEVAGQWVVLYLVIACLGVLAGLVYSGTDPKWTPCTIRTLCFVATKAFFSDQVPHLGVQVPLYDF